MTIQERLTEAMKVAMRAKDSLRLNTIRMMRTAIKNREIDTRSELSETEAISILSTLVKQRRESAAAYRNGGRDDLAAKEEQELAIVQEFLPSQLDEAGIRELIEKAVLETGATSPKDMGKVMKVVSAQTTGRADGRLVSELVKARLAG
ncbi:GatB/YqeY domain-containing protein [Desulfuromonas carbonis]